MKRFALATMLLTLMGLNIGCNGGASDTPAPEVDAPKVEDPAGDDAMGEDDAAGETDETPAE